MATLIGNDIGNYQQHGHYVSALNNKRISEIKKDIHRWFEDARLLGCNIHIDIELVNFPSESCGEIWCSARDISPVHDLIQLVRAVNSQADNFRFGCDTVLDSIIIDGTGFDCGSCALDDRQQEIANQLYGGMGL